jgi:hypothetical protein
MVAECNGRTLQFQGVGRREVIARFDGGDISSDGGSLLLREIESRTKVVEQFAGCFTDHRNPDLIEHTAGDLVAQRVFGLALGYEDLNDHDDLRSDPLLAVAVGKTDPKGKTRVRERDRGKALAGKSTLNRLELTKADATAGERYKKIVLDGDAVDQLLVDLFLQAHPEPPEEIEIDLDATDDPLHGKQEGRFFHGYYGHYCYLPLYVFCGEFLLCARLRPSDIDASAGSIEELERIVTRLRQAWPELKILVRADSGFCRESIMAWCEENDVNYVFGVAKNDRLIRRIGGSLKRVEKLYQETGEPAREFRELRYRTRDSWSRVRRVVAKAEHLQKGSNPRFIVTSLTPEEVDGQTLYEVVYCARGDMENRIKEQQLFLFADRTSTATMRANQIRLYFSSIAYVLMHALRRIGLRATDFAKAQCNTIRLKLFKIGALVRVTFRKVWVSLSQSCPYAQLFARVHANLTSSPSG